MYTSKIVTKVFVEKSCDRDVLERDINEFLSTRKFISQTSSATMDDDFIFITVVVMAEEYDIL